MASTTKHVRGLGPAAGIGVPVAAVAVVAGALGQACSRGVPGPGNCGRIGTPSLP